MPTQQTANEKPAVVDSSLLPAGDEERVRELAVKQIERKRRFHMRAFSAAAVSVALLIIWAIAEYHDAGGWPTSGFSQSSGIPHVWNSWIIYPVVALVLAWPSTLGTRTGASRSPGARSGVRWTG